MRIDTLERLLDLPVGTVLRFQPRNDKPVVFVQLQEVFRPRKSVHREPYALLGVEVTADERVSHRLEPNSHTTYYHEHWWAEQVELSEAVGKQFASSAGLR